MGMRIAFSLTAAVLAAGATTLAPSFAATSSSTPPVTLTKAQRQTLWKELHGHAVTVTPSPQFAEQVGAKVPNTIPLMGMPAMAGKGVPAVKTDKYTAASGKLLIVSPKARTIVDVISE